MAGRVLPDIQKSSDPHHHAWDWGHYHAELLRRIETLPPLMRSVQNARRNRADWLALEQFPLPTFRFEDAGDKTMRKRSLAKAPVMLDSEHPDVTIETRCGTVAHILRASLIAALVKARSEKLRTFFGCSFDEAETPRIAYTNWRALVGSPDDPEMPPTGQNDNSAKPNEANQNERAIHTPSLWDLMIRSIPFIDGSAHGTPTQRRELAQNTSTNNAGRPGQVQERAEHPQPPLPPTTLVIDAIGAPLSYDLAIIAISRELAELTKSFDSIPYQQDISSGKNWTAVIILSTAFHITHESFAHGFRQKVREDIVFVDAPTTQAERRTFMEAWERWRAPRALQRKIEQKASCQLEQLRSSLSSLRMIVPEVTSDGIGFQLEGKTSIATFDIECVISATLRDNMLCATPSQLWLSLSERLHPREIESARKALAVFLQGRALLSDVPNLAAAIFLKAYFLLPNTQGMRSELLSSTVFEFMFTALPHQSSKSLSSLAYDLITELRNNPLLTALILPLEERPNELTAFQLLNEPLAVAMVAHDAVAVLQQTNDLDEFGDVLFAVFLMSIPVWTHFVEDVFELLDESTLPGLAADVLNNLAGALNIWTGEETYDCVEQNSSQSSDNFIDEFILKTNKLLLSRPNKRRLHEYIDALAHVSIQHVIGTNSYLPWAWASWIGLLSSAEDIPDASIYLDRINLLTRLLNEPVPTCDNALKLLRILYDIVLVNVKPGCPCYVHKDVLRRYLLQRFPQRP